eukprot:1384591-Amorphochlora_amoeboformis.AAC.1
MGGHDCPATRYLIMSDETAFAWTMIFLFSGIAAAWLARYRKRWFYTGSLGRNGNGNNAGRMSRVPTGDLLGYGSFSAKTLTLDRSNRRYCIPDCNIPYIPYTAKFEDILRLRGLLVYPHLGCFLGGGGGSESFRHLTRSTLFPHDILLFS